MTTVVDPAGSLVGVITDGEDRLVGLLRLADLLKQGIL